MTKLSAKQLAEIPNGAEVIWVFLAGSNTNRHRAVVKKRVNQTLLLHVYFDGATPDGRRWSLITNQPLHEWRGHTGGEVWLELAAWDEPR